MTIETIAHPEIGTWAIDPAHTVVGFSARHLMAAKVRGSFEVFSGTVQISDTPEASSVDVSIDAASINTGVGDRDNHLRSPDFLDVENYPTLSFRSTAVRREGAEVFVDGDLSIRGVTKPVTLDLQFHGVATDPWGNEKALFSATTEIEREAWGLTWNAPLEAGGWLVGKTVSIELEIQAAKAS
ncbi:MAG: YceI family protein [Acidimicrobiia bacterium]|nr:YceI family protein [Acidimicrobiia bacterium]